MVNIAGITIRQTAGQHARNEWSASQEWVVTMRRNIQLSRTIKDGRVISLIHRYLQAGIVVANKFEQTAVGVAGWTIESIVEQYHA